MIRRRIKEFKNYEQTTQMSVAKPAADAKELLRGVNQVFEPIRHFTGAFSGQEVFCKTDNTLYLWEEGARVWIEVSHAMAEGTRSPRYIPPKDTEEHIKEKLDIFEKTLNNEDD